MAIKIELGQNNEKKPQSAFVSILGAVGHNKR